MDFFGWMTRGMNGAATEEEEEVWDPEEQFFDCFDEDGVDETPAEEIAAVEEPQPELEGEDDPRACAALLMPRMSRRFTESRKSLNPAGRRQRALMSRPPPVDTSELPDEFHALAPGTLTVTATHTLDMSAVTVWRLAFSDATEAMQLRYHTEVLGHRNVVIGRWAPHETHGLVRLSTYETDTGAPVGPKETRILEYEAVKRAGDLASFEIRTDVYALDASYSDRFHVEGRMTVRNETGADPPTCKLEWACGVFFSRSVPMLQGLITKTVMEEYKHKPPAWLEMVKAERPLQQQAKGKSARRSTLFFLVQALTGDDGPSRDEATKLDVLDEESDGEPESPSSVTSSSEPEASPAPRPIKRTEPHTARPEQSIEWLLGQAAVRRKSASLGGNGPLLATAAIDVGPGAPLSRVAEE